MKVSGFASAGNAGEMFRSPPFQDGVSIAHGFENGTVEMNAAE
ncbi:hypothetical protein [Pseudarthrobacter sp. MM222]|nr:hypothetical protein [Pseudarthrobacter sp. MM222]CAI3801753.1 hypothetical protein NKCBBBOE_02920 [Pseudarthrobacter sp. MM222]